MSNEPPTDAQTREEILTSHNYDGIQEYDNPTPGWWNWLFILSIVVAPIYVVWFHSSVVDRTLAAQYEEAKNENLKLQFGEIGTLEPTRANVVKYMNDDKWLPVGAATFATHCKSCHGADGQGISAPNLTDDIYIHVNNIEDIAKIVNNGAKNGAMPAWASRLHPNEVVMVASYVASLRGQDLPSSYKVEGKVIDPWPESVESVEPANEDSDPKEDSPEPSAESDPEDSDANESDSDSTGGDETETNDSPAE